MDRARVELIKKMKTKILKLQNSCPARHHLFRMMPVLMRNTTKVRSDEADKETMALSVEGQLVHYKLERPSYLLYFWEVADRHQVLQSSLQRLSNGTGASDASCAGISTAPSSASRGSSRKLKRRQQDDDSEESTLLPLVQSIRELADCQRQLMNDRDEDRNHEQRMNQVTQSMTMREQCRERVFRRKAELTDAARSYQKLNAELDPNNEQSSRLSVFYISECLMIEDEIRSLELENFNEDV